MAQQAVADRISEDLDGPDEVGPRGLARRPSGRTPLVFIVLLNLLVIVGGVGAYLSLLRDPPAGSDAAGENEGSGHAVNEASVIYDVPDLLVALNGAGSEPARLKIAIALEVEDQATVERLETVLPLVLDNFRVYLRELAAEDLSGPAGSERMREELLMRVNAAIGPAKVREVRLKELRIE